MKDSSNLSFFIKILALVVLLLAGYSKDQIFTQSELQNDRFSKDEKEFGTAVYFTPLTTNEKSTSLASLTSKK